jgi:hypothetical protein
MYEERPDRAISWLVAIVAFVYLILVLWSYGLFAWFWNIMGG